MWGDPGLIYEMCVSDLSVLVSMAFLTHDSSCPLYGIQNDTVINPSLISHTCITKVRSNNSVKKIRGY